MTLCAQGLVAGYGGHRALDGVDFEVGDGEFVSLVGPNGAGKTTLLHVLTGRLRPETGTVRFAGRDIAGLAPARLARLGLARSFQLVAVFAELSVLDTLRVAVGVRSRRQRHPLAGPSRAVTEEARELAGLFGLGTYLAAPAGSLSQGDKKLLDVAAAFAGRPTTILLDEPTSGVNSTDKRAVMDTIVGAGHRLGVRSIVAVEHDLDLVFAYSDRVVALHQGHVVADGPTAAVRADPAVMATIGGQVAGC
jgi:branched-chain amino acid transport system ATP-binding protein